MTIFKYQVGDDLLSFEGERVRVLSRWAWSYPFYEVEEYRLEGTSYPDPARVWCVTEGQLSDWEF